MIGTIVRLEKLVGIQLQILIMTAMDAEMLLKMMMTTETAF